jgi:ABC-type glycerol-3-phosphate transport system substrate-binding protein
LKENPLRKRSLVLALLAALAIALVAAGCGGGGGSSSGSTSDTTADSGGSSTESESSGPAPTKAAFIKEADAICSKADAVMTEEITDFAKENNIKIEEEEPSEDQEVEIFDAVVLGNIGRQAEEIAALTPPEGDEATVEDITDTLSTEVAEAEEAGGIPDESTLEEASKKAKAYGLKTCGN